MIRIYFDAYRSVILAAALFKTAADVLNIVGPLCIGALTSYVATLSNKDPVDSEPVGQLSTIKVPNSEIRDRAFQSKKKLQLWIEQI